MRDLGLCPTILRWQLFAVKFYDRSFMIYTVAPHASFIHSHETFPTPQHFLSFRIYSHYNIQVLDVVVLPYLAEIIASSSRINYLRPRKDKTESHPIRRTSLAKKDCMWYYCIRIKFGVIRSLYEVCRMSACFIAKPPNGISWNSVLVVLTERCLTNFRFFSYLFVF